MKLGKKGYGFVLLGLALFAGVSALVMVLWNALVPTIFGLTALTFWQAAGLFLLSKILFGGHWGGKGGWHHKHKHGFHHHNKMHQKWMNMSSDQRQDFVHKRKHFMHDCCSGNDFIKPDSDCCKADEPKKSDKD